MQNKRNKSFQIRFWTCWLNLSVFPSKFGNLFLKYVYPYIFAEQFQEFNTASMLALLYIFASLRNKKWVKFCQCISQGNCIEIFLTYLIFGSIQHFINKTIREQYLSCVTLENNFKTKYLEPIFTKFEYCLLERRVFSSEQCLLV